jgi:hypothetical protein
VTTFSQICVQALLKANDISAPVQTHLGKVFSGKACFDLAGPALTHSNTTHLDSDAVLTLGVGAAAVGAWTHTVTGLGGGFISAAAVFGLLLWLLYQQDKQNTPKRLALFVAFGFSQGMSIGGLIDVILAVDPNIAVIALVATTSVFACFAGFSLLSRRRSMLYLGGILGSALSWLLLGSLLNSFVFQSAALVCELCGPFLPLLLDDPSHHHSPSIATTGIC